MYRGRLSWRLVTLVLSVGAMSAIQAQQPEPLFALPPPELLVSRTPRAPAIDGKILPNEWRFAAAATGFVNLADGNVAAEQTTFYLTYDTDRLYLAFEAKLTSERSPAAAESRRDGGVWADESIEVYLQPAGATADSVRHFIGNSIGTIFDRKGSNRSWNANWEFANDAGMGYWTAELAIAFSELDAGDPVGSAWRVNIGRNAGMHTSWSYTGRAYGNPERFGTVRFAEKAGTVRFADLGGLNTNRLSVGGEAFNPGQSSQQILLGVRSQVLSLPPGSPLPRLDEAGWRPDLRMTLAGAGSKEFSVSRSSADAARRLLHVEARQTGGTTLLRQLIPYVPQAPQYVRFVPVPAEEHVFIRIDLGGLAIASPAEVTVRARAASGDFERELRLTVPRTDRIEQRRESVSDWPAGPYTCRYRVRSAVGGTSVHEGTFEYERRKAPQWYTVGRQLGRADTVLPPWTPVLWRDDGIEVWGRRYRCSRELLLDQVVSAGAALLDAAMRLECVADGKLFQARLTERAVTRQSDTGCVLSSHGRLGPLQVHCVMTVEFDGMAKVELLLHSAEPVTVDALRLVLPFRRQHAIYYHQCASYYGRSAAGLVPEGGVEMLFRPFVWLGDDERGLMWFAESPDGWHVTGKPITIRRTGEVTELRVDVVNVSEVMREKKLVFGLMATPAKPAPADWRAWRVDRIWSPAYARKHAVDWEQEGIALQWRYLWWTSGLQRIFTPGHTTPLQVTDSLGDYVRDWHARGTRLVPYMYLHGVNRIATDFERYYPAWQTSSPKEMAYYGRVIMGACPGGDWFADYLLYGIDQWVKTHGVDGVYFDGAGPPVPCANALHGHGWLDDAGRRHIAYPIFGLREFYKRLWTILSEQVERPVIWVHADGKMPIPCFSFATANWEGEMVQGSMKGGESVLSELLPLDWWRAHAVATQWGVVPMWLFSVFGNEEQQARQQDDQLALLLVHGTPMGRTGRPPREVIRRLWRAQHEFGIGEAEFHGYWQSADLLRVTPSQERLVASVYERDGSVMLVVGNFTDREERVTVEFLPRVQLQTDALIDCFTEGVTPVVGRRVTCRVPARSFRLLTSRAASR